MSSLTLKRTALLIVVMFMLTSCSIRIFHRNPEKQLFGRNDINSKEVKVKEPHRVVRAKKQQEANDRRLKKAYNKGIKKSQKRTYDIQTPDVQSRMKQNKKAYTSRDKKMKHKERTGTKKAGKKYN